MTSSSINQLFGFNYPTYYAQLSLTLPLKNRAAKAEMGNALVSRRSDLYTERQTREQVTLDVSNAVHQLEQAKLSIAAGKESLDLAKKTWPPNSANMNWDRRQSSLCWKRRPNSRMPSRACCRPKSAIRSPSPSVDHATGELLEPYHVQIAELTQ